MRLPFVRSTPLALAFVVLVPATNCASLVFAAQQPSRPAGRDVPAAAGPAPAPPASFAAEPVDARRTRETLRELLQRHPPTLAQILKLDPSMLSNDAFLAGYPALAAFVAQHPEVRQSADFYLDDIYVPVEGPRDAHSRVFQLWEDVLGGIAGLTVFVTLTLTLVWLIKTILNYRRWNRLSRVQAEVHAKLLDRFTASDELLAYVQTPSGRRFLESAPIQLDDAPRNIAAPFGRILLSVQAGVVLVALGSGFQLVSSRAPQEISQVISLLGILAIALGLGFVASAAVSYLLSRRLGLLNTAPADSTERATAG